MLPLHRLFALGDVVTVTGLLERSKARLSIHARVIVIEESFESLFGPNVMFRDDAYGMEHPEIWAQVPVSFASPSREQSSLAPGGPASGRLLLLQVVHSHAARLQEYLRVCHHVETLATVAPMSGPHNARDERCLLLRTDAPAALIHAVLSDGAMARFVQRWYLLDSLAPTMAHAAEALAEALKRSHGGATPVPVRVQAFPKDLEVKIVDRLRATGAVELNPRASTMACLTYVFGALAVGVADGAGEYHEAFDAANRAVQRPREPRPGRTFSLQERGPAEVSAVAQGVKSPGLSMSVGGAGAAGDMEGADESAAFLGTQVGPTGGHVCRAFYKLREIASRLQLPLDVPYAIDIGASPGGWTTCLVQSGCRRVVAVDPGQLHLPPDVELSGKVEHMRMRIEEALPILESRGSVRLDMLVCDMNAPPADVLAIALQTLPLLNPGAALVLTFKNAFARRVDWHVALEAALEELRGFADNVSVVHLLANTTKETTVVGTVRAGDPTTPPLAAADHGRSKGYGSIPSAWEWARMISGRRP